MEEERLTLISDATDEFPNNTNNSYRVRIPDGLRLEGTGWHIALLSLTLPNSTSVQSTVIKANHPPSQTATARPSFQEATRR